MALGEHWPLLASPTTPTWILHTRSWRFRTSLSLSLPATKDETERLNSGGDVRLDAIDKLGKVESTTEGMGAPSPAGMFKTPIIPIVDIRGPPRCQRPQRSDGPTIDDDAVNPGPITIPERPVGQTHAIGQHILAEIKTAIQNGRTPEARPAP